MNQVRGTGSTFQTTVRGVEVWQATKTITIDHIKKRVTGRGATPVEAWKRLEENHTRLLVKYGKAPASFLRGYSKETKLTVQEWLGQWMSDKSNKKVAPNTKFRQQGIIENHINPYIGSKQLRDLDEDHIRKLIYDTLPNLKNKDGSQKLGSSPIRGAYYILKQALEVAHKQNLVGYNAIAAIKPPAKDKPKDERIEDKTDIPKKLILSTRKKDTEAYWILCFYGLRQSERLGLEWSSFSNLEKDDGSATLIIDRQLYNNAMLGELQLKYDTKTKAGIRILPLPQNIRQAFLRQRRRQAEWKKSEAWNPTAEFKNLVFTSETGAPVRHSSDNRNWAALLKANDIPHMRQHAMRHITATMLAQEGVPADIVMALLGHNSSAMTSYYTHIGTKAKIPAVEAISKAISEDMYDFIQNRSPKLATV